MRVDFTGITSPDCLQRPNVLHNKFTVLSSVKGSSTSRYYQIFEGREVMHVLIQSTQLHPAATNSTTRRPIKEDRTRAETNFSYRRGSRFGKQSWRSQPKNNKFSRTLNPKPQALNEKPKQSPAWSIGTLLLSGLLSHQHQNPPQSEDQILKFKPRTDSIPPQPSKLTLSEHCAGCRLACIKRVELDLFVRDVYHPVQTSPSQVP